MVRRWSLSLLAANALLAFLLLGIEELHSWHQYESWQREEERSQRTFSPVLTKEDEQAMTVDYWPDVRMRTFHSLNLPMSVLVGWYSHPLSIHANSILGPSLLRGTQRLSVKRRVATLDAVLLFGVCLQWWLVGLWLEHSVPLVRLLKVVAAGMTALGTAMTLVVVPGSAGETTVIQATVDVLSLIVAFGWVLLIVTGTVSVALTTTRAIREAF
jgi:hypothetical protein